MRAAPCRSEPTRTGSPAPTRSACPSRANCRSTCRSAAERPTARSSTSGAGRCRGRSPAPAHFEVAATNCASRFRFRRASTVGKPYFFPRPTASSIMRRRRHSAARATTLVAELASEEATPSSDFRACSPSATGEGWSSGAMPGPCPKAGRSIGDARREALLWAVLGAIAGGMLLNLMPCVFPILALKALHLSRAAARAREARARTPWPTRRARSSAPARSASRCSLIRAGGSAAGWAFQLQDPRTIMLLLLLATAITAQSARPVRIAGRSAARRACRQLRHRRARGVRRDAVRRAVPRRRARHRLAAAGGGIGAGVRRARTRPGAAVPASIAFVPALRRCCRARAVDGAAAALPGDADGGDGGRLPVAALAAGGLRRCWSALARSPRCALLSSLALVGFSAAERAAPAGSRRCRACRRRRLRRCVPSRRLAARRHPFRRRGAVERGARSRATSRRASRCSSISPPTGA